MFLVSATIAHGGTGSTAFMENAHGSGSGPEELYATEGGVFFSANDGIHGRELWRINQEGVTAMVGDFRPGPEGSSPRNFTAFGDRLYFVADWQYTTRESLGEAIFSVSLEGHDPVRHDGGTRLLGSLRSVSILPAGPVPLVALASDELGRGIWELRGQRLFPVVDDVPGIFRVQEYYGWSGQRLLYAVRPASVSSRRLRVYDTAAGTDKNLRSHSGAGDVFVLYAETVNDRVWYAGAVGNLGVELCVTDGTAAGTRMVADINPGVADSLPKDFAAHKGTLYFQANDGVHGVELWRSDGTAAGTRIVADINPGPAGSHPFFFRSVGGQLLFAATRDDVGKELWRSDGTAEGTTLVRDIYPGGESSHLYQPTVHGDLLFFAANHPTHGEELWRSDGTAVGTFLVRDINVGPELSEPYYLTSFGSYLYFCANDGVHGEEVWRSDGTRTGTVMIKDVRPERRVVRSSNPTDLAATRDAVFLAADDLRHGEELWRAGNDGGGAELVRDIRPGEQGSGPRDLVACDNAVYFSADDGTRGAVLWRSDGTAAGTTPVSLGEDGASILAPRLLIRVQESVCFVALAEDGTSNLYVVADSGTVAHRVTGWATQADETVSMLRGVGTQVYICLYQPDYRCGFAVLDLETHEVRSVDWTTQESSDWHAVIDRGGSDTLQCYLTLPALATRQARMQDAWYFVARTAAQGAELWRCSGDARTASLVRDGLPGVASSGPDELTVVGGRLFFAADHPSGGRELWCSDGTESGTYVVNDPEGLTFRGTGPRGQVAFGDTVMYAAPGSARYFERTALTSCKDTLNGLLVTTAAGPMRYWPDNPGDLTPLGDCLYFTADHPGIGRELWRYCVATQGETFTATYALVKDIAADAEYTGAVSVTNELLSPSRRE
jgi:ELWxxDGT repeat protein